MYTLTGAYGRLKGPGQKWNRLDVGDIPLKELYTRFRDVFLFVEHPFYDGRQHLDISLIPAYLNPTQVTKSVRVWLIELGNTGLPVEEGVVHYEEIVAPYVDAWAAGCDIEPVHPEYHRHQDVPKSDKRDLLLTHPHLSGETLKEQFLVTVNGFFHYGGQTSEGLQIVEGGTNHQRTNNNMVGLWKLGELGVLETYRLREKHIFRTGQPLKNGITFLLEDDIDISQKTVFFVLGGIFHIKNDYIKRVGERIWSFDIKNYPFTQHFFELQTQADLSTMQRYHDRSTANTTQVATEELWSDESIKAFLTLPHSFIVIVDTPEVYTEQILTEDTGTPGVVRSPVKPHYPLVQHLGRHVNYWWRPDGLTSLLFFKTTTRPSFTFETTGWRQEHSVDDSRVPYQPFVHTPAFLLKVTTYDY